mgnify:CR=1 FL=1
MIFFESDLILSRNMYVIYLGSKKLNKKMRLHIFKLFLY